MYRKSLIISTTAICAALYALGALATAYIESPWGRGQFRPAVVIPMFFATIFGPIVGGVGAALGTFIADSIKHGGPYIPSLIAAVPGNFLGFFVYGLIVRRFSWYRFIVASHVGLLIGNFVTALLYIWYVFGRILPGLVVGFVLWWYITMLPFVLLLVPVLIRATSRSFPSIIRENVRTASLGERGLKFSVSLSLIFPGVFMILLGILLFVYPSLIDFFFPEPLAKLRNIVGDLLRLMFVGTGVANAFCGLLLLGSFLFKK